MDLVTRGRLSVQRVGEDVWAAIELMAENGGWEELDMKPKKKKGVKLKGSTSNADKSEKGEKAGTTTKLGKEKDRSRDNEGKSEDDQVHTAANSSSIKRKRGTAYFDVDVDDPEERHGLRRSNRAKK